MKLSKAERETVRMMFGGMCAYCGTPLTGKWHADHVEAVFRVTKYVRGQGYVATGELNHPENDTIGNLFPACVPCNIDKGMCTPEDYRAKLMRSHDLLTRNYSAYRHAHRFGVVAVNPAPVVFHFERHGRTDCQSVTSTEPL